MWSVGEWLASAGITGGALGVFGSGADVLASGVCTVLGRLDTTNFNPSLALYALGWRTGSLDAVYGGSGALDLDAADISSLRITIWPSRNPDESIHIETHFCE
jgi:hypothetical protein